MWRRNKNTQDREESRSFSMIRFQNVRKIYAEIAEVLARNAENGGAEEQDHVASLLTLLARDETPTTDQGVVDFFSDFYVFVIFGYNEETYPEGIRNWEDLHDRISKLGRSSL